MLCERYPGCKPPARKRRSVTVRKGLINQIEHLGRSYAAVDTGHYNRVLPGDIVHTKSPAGDFPLGIIKQSKILAEVIVSPLYGVFTPTNRVEARHATAGAPRRFCQTWRNEEDRDEAIDPLANRPLTAAEADAVFLGDFAFARAHFEALAAMGPRAITAQDRAIHVLCRPERLLDLTCPQGGSEFPD